MIDDEELEREKKKGKVKAQTHSETRRTGGFADRTKWPFWGSGTFNVPFLR